MKRVKITYPSGREWIYKDDNPYNSICPAGMYGDMNPEIIDCDRFLRYNNVRDNSCDSCSVKKWCKVFNEANAYSVWGFSICISGHEWHLQTPMFMYKDAAEKFMRKYIADLIRELRVRRYNRIVSKREGNYYIVLADSSWWYFQVVERKMYLSCPR
jgi:hypothetical protein